MYMRTLFLIGGRRPNPSPPPGSRSPSSSSSMLAFPSFRVSLHYGSPPALRGGILQPPPPLVEIPPATVTAPPVAHSGIRAAKSDLEYGLREYMILQKRRYRTDDVAIEARLRAQAANLVSDLDSLRNEVAAVVRTAESQRWRRWIAGTAV